MNSQPSFLLITENHGVQAVIVNEELSAPQLRAVTAIAGAALWFNEKLTRRWNVQRVICRDSWAEKQLARVPCTVPKDGLKLSFAEPAETE